MSSRRYVIMTPFHKPEVLAGICKLHDLDVWVVPADDGALVVRDLPVKEYDDWDIAELLGDAPSSGAPDNAAQGGSPAGGDSAPSAESDAEATAARSTGDAGTVAKDGADGAEEDQSDSAEEDQSDSAPEDGSDSAEIDADDGVAVARELAKLSRAGVVLLTAELGDDVGQEAGVSGMVTGMSILSTGESKDVPAGILVATAPQILEDLLIGAIAPAEAEGAISTEEIEPNILHKLAARGKRREGTEEAPGSDKKLPPKKPRRFFGR